MCVTHVNQAGCEPACSWCNELGSGVQCSDYYMTWNAQYKRCQQSGGGCTGQGQSWEEQPTGWATCDAPGVEPACRANLALVYPGSWCYDLPLDQCNDFYYVAHAQEGALKECRVVDEKCTSQTVHSVRGCLGSEAPPASPPAPTVTTSSAYLCYHKLPASSPWCYLSPGRTSQAECAQQYFERAYGDGYRFCTWINGNCNGGRVVATQPTTCTAPSPAPPPSPPTPMGDCYTDLRSAYGDMQFCYQLSAAVAGGENGGCSFHYHRADENPQLFRLCEDSGLDNHCKPAHWSRRIRKIGRAHV